MYKAIFPFLDNSLDNLIPLHAHEYYDLDFVFPYLYAGLKSNLHCLLYLLYFFH